MKRTPLRRASKNKIRKTEKRIAEQSEFFHNIWNSTPRGDRKCQGCGKPLYEPIRSYYFDHLIEKSKRPDLALEKDNIFLCCLECHALKTDGHPTEPHRLAIEKAKEKFGI